MGICSSIRKTITTWWNGEYIHQDPPFVMGFYKRHWTASTVSAVISFYLEHWKWIWTTLISLVALFFTAQWLK